eukprot:g34620.t1
MIAQVRLVPSITIPGYVLSNRGGCTVVYSQEAVALGVLNIDFRPHEASWHQQCDKAKTNTLEEHEIEEFCNLLMQRPELDEIFQHFSGQGQWLTVREVENFLKEQKEVSTAVTCLSIMQKYGFNDN